MEVCWSEGALFQFDVIVSLQELLMCFWQKVAQILYFCIILSYGEVPDLSLPSHNDSSAKNGLQCNMRAKATQRTHWGIFQKTVLMPFSWELCHLFSRPAQLWGSYYSSPYWTFSEKCAVHLLIRQKRNLPSGPWRNFMCEGRPCRHNLQIYQNVILLSQNIFFPLKWGFLWKSLTFVSQNGTLSVISWINTPCNTCLSGGQQR